MAKVSGPLFSFGASGTVAKLLTFNQSNGAPVARKKPRASTSATTKQLTERQDFREAMTLWNALDPIERAEWVALSAPYARPACAKYYLEYKAQGSTPARPPYLPMA